jgi:hypothetical protein
MAILSTAPIRTYSTSPAARVLFDATIFRNTSPGFAAGLLPLTTEEIGQALDDHFGPYVEPVESFRTIEQWAADEADLSACSGPAWEAEVAAVMAARPGPTPEELVIEAMAHLSGAEMDDDQWATWHHAVTAGSRKREADRLLRAQAAEAARADAMDARAPRAKGYDAQDLADFAAGRTITLDELLAREDAEDEARSMASMPAEAFEEMACSRPYLA